MDFNLDRELHRRFAPPAQGTVLHDANLGHLADALGISPGHADAVFQLLEDLTCAAFEQGAQWSWEQRQQDILHLTALNAREIDSLRLHQQLETLQERVGLSNIRILGPTGMSWRAEPYSASKRDDDPLGHGR